MDKNRFSVDTQYSVTLKEPTGRLRPANLYVYRLYDDYMIARRTDGDRSGLLFKIPYGDIVRIVRTLPVPDPKRFLLPEAMLNAKVWETRDSMMTYASSPGLGK